MRRRALVCFAVFCMVFSTAAAFAAPSWLPRPIHVGGTIWKGTGSSIEVTGDTVTDLTAVTLTIGTQTGNLFNGTLALTASDPIDISGAVGPLDPYSLNISSVGYVITGEVLRTHRKSFLVIHGQNTVTGATFTATLTKQ